VERLILPLLLTLVSCTPQGKAAYDAWDTDFIHRPDFSHSVTALWIATYQEDSEHRFIRSMAWGQVPEKLVPGDGGYTVAVPLLMQSETSDGPRPDRFVTVLVRVVQDGESFSVAPNDALPGTVTGWVDTDNRTVHFRGKTGTDASPRVLWQFQGRY
jgi:hypothetical protein